MNDIQIRRALSKDEIHIRKLLSDAQLPFEDIGEHLDNFLIAEFGDITVGTVGVQIYDEIGLLRSLAVAVSYQNKGIGRMLYDRMVAYARLKGVGRFYLLTTTAEGIFRRLGFDVIDREKLPDEIRATNEFRKLCPENALCMFKDITREIYYVPRSIQNLVASVPGASMLAVSLEKAMLTYFEIAPGARFDKHRHESEQITFVIEGRLVFEIDGRTIRVGPGEVIAIPSNASHAAFAETEQVRAVDAWSPVRREFIKKT